MPYFIKLYIFIVAYKAITALIPNVILTWPDVTWRYFKNAYRAYKALFKLGKEVQQKTI